MKKLSIERPIVRKWLYGISIAITACMLTWGAINGDQKAALDTLSIAVFGIAFMNVPDSNNGDKDAE